MITAPFRVFVLLLGLLVPAPLFGQLMAFPGAVGQGATALGGRGGDVYHVTTLEDYDPQKSEPKIQGSLRHAIRSATGPRTIVFDVSGVILLHGQLEILKDQLTLAGQTSPGGITLCGYPLEISGCTDVVVRFIRVRTGDFEVVQPVSLPPQGLDPGSANAVNIGGGCDRVILDHVSASWGIDETLSVTRCRNITVQHCIIAESLNASFHPKGPHGYGSLIRGDLTAEDQRHHRGGYTFLGNLWAHHRARNPSIGGEQRFSNNAENHERRRTDVNIVNNVIYNWGDAPTHRSQGGQVRINLIGNYFINGPAKASNYIFREGDNGVTAVYHEGNYHDADQDARHNGVVIDSSSGNAFRQFDPLDQLLDSAHDRPFGFLPAHVAQLISAEEAYSRVVRSVGASLWRDAIDRRIIASVTQRTGKIIDSQEEWRDADGRLPGIEDLPAQQRPSGFDSDGDGMPDEFEQEQGLNPFDAADGNQSNLSPAGYTNLEVYLNRLVENESETVGAK